MFKIRETQIDRLLFEDSVEDISDKLPESDLYTMFVARFDVPESLRILLSIFIAQGILPPIVFLGPFVILFQFGSAECVESSSLFPHHFPSDSSLTSLVIWDSVLSRGSKKAKCIT